MRSALTLRVAVLVLAQSAIAVPGRSLELWALDGHDGFALNGTAALAKAGASVSGAGDINGDGIADLVVGSPQAGSNAPNAGAVHVVFGRATGFAPVMALAGLDGSNGFTLTGIGNDDLAGLWVSAAGDVNGDGIDDLAVAAPLSHVSGIRFGDAYVVFGSTRGFPASLSLAGLDGSNGFALRGSGPFAPSVNSASGAGDVNGDGIDDLVVGCRGGDTSGPGLGEVRVVYGSRAPRPASFDLSSLDGSSGFAIKGVSGGSDGTTARGAGDVNHDGIDDLVVGALGDSGEKKISEIGVVFGSRLGFPAVFQTSALDGTNGFVLREVSGADAAGNAVDRAGDVNGDGIDDLVVGAFYADPHGNTSGESYVIFGSAAPTPAVRELSALDGSNGFVIHGGDAYDKSGNAVSAAGDVNADGVDDLVIGAPGADSQGFSTGEAYVLFGSRTAFPPSLELSAIDGDRGFRIRGIDATNFTGVSVRGAGDVNADGVADVVIGSPLADATGRDSGQAYVVFGRADVGAPRGIAGRLRGVLNGTVSCWDIRSKQRVSTSLTSSAAWNCETAGLAAQTGDTIVMTISAAADYDAWYGTTDVRGAVTGIAPTSASCRSLVTGSTVGIPLAGRAAAWNCSTAGLAVHGRGESIFIGVVGTAR